MGELPVRVTGNIHSGFTAEFTPVHVGAHTINVDYNGYPVHVRFPGFRRLSFSLSDTFNLSGNAICRKVLRCQESFRWICNEGICRPASAIHS